MSEKKHFPGGGVALCRYFLPMFSAMLFCIASLTGFAQKYNFTQYSVADGLAQSQPLCFVQNRQGLLFIGTLSGLSVFDGSRFSNFDKADGLPQNAITHLARDKDGNIWLGTTNGISCYDGRHFSNFYPKDSAGSNVIADLAIDNENSVWALLSDGQLFVLEAGEERFQKIREVDSVVCMTLDKKGSLWIVRKGVKLLHKTATGWQNAWEAAKNDKGLIVFRLKTGSVSGNLYCSTTAGIRIFQHGKLNLPEWSHEISEKMFVYEVLESQSGRIWLAASDGGVWEGRGGQWKHYGYDQGFTNEPVNQIFQDNEGNIWLATNGSGVFRFGGGAFTFYDRTSGLPVSNIMSIAQMASGILYFSGSNRGLYSLQEGQIRNISLPKTFSKVTTLYCDSGKTLWIGTDTKGLWAYSAGTFTPVKTVGNYAPEGITSIRKISGELWVSALNGLFRSNERGDLQRLHVNRPVFTFLPVQNHRIVLSTSNGVYLYDIIADSLFSKPLLRSVSIPCMAASGGNVFFGTDNSGVEIWNSHTNKWQVLTQKDGLSCNYVYSLLKDNEGNIWAGTGCGIDVISVSAVDKFKIRKVAAAYGLSGIENNSNASFEDRDGFLWFGTTRGLFRYNPKEGSKLLSRHKAPDIMLQSVKLFSKDIPPGRYSDSSLPFSTVPYRPVFPTTQNNLTFTFKAIALSGAQQIKYRYQLVGMDKTYTDAVQNTVTYSGLPPGDYVFKVWASDAEGNWYAKALKWPFTINTPYYSTWYFRLGMALILVGLFLGMVYWRNRAKSRRLHWEQKLREEEQNRIRQRTAEDFHDEIGNKLTRIKLLASVAESKFKNHQDEVPELLAQIKQNAATLYTGAKDIIWSLQPQSDYLAEVLLRIQRNAESLFEYSGITFCYEQTGSAGKEEKLPADYGRNLIMIFKEATNNILKHAAARNVKLCVSVDKKRIIINLEDDGKGLPENMEENATGNGLQNMQRRADRFHAYLKYCTGQTGKGTVIRVEVPLP